MSKIGNQVDNHPHNTEQKARGKGDKSPIGDDSHKGYGEGRYSAKGMDYHIKNDCSSKRTNRVVQKPQFLNNFRLKNSKMQHILQDLFDNQPGY
jgi:hypothetical protein